MAVVAMALLTMALLTMALLAMALLAIPTAYYWQARMAGAATRGYSLG